MQGRFSWYLGCLYLCLVSASSIAHTFDDWVKNHPEAKFISQLQETISNLSLPELVSSIERLGAPFLPDTFRIKVMCRNRVVIQFDFYHEASHSPREPQFYLFNVRSDLPELASLVLVTITEHVGVVFKEAGLEHGAVLEKLRVIYSACLKSGGIQVLEFKMLKESERLPVRILSYLKQPFSFSVVPGKTDAALPLIRQLQKSDASIVGKGMTLYLDRQEAVHLVSEKGELIEGKDGHSYATMATSTGGWLKFEQNSSGPFIDLFTPEFIESFLKDPATMHFMKDVFASIYPDARETSIVFSIEGYRTPKIHIPLQKGCSDSLVSGGG